MPLLLFSFIQLHSFHLSLSLSLSLTLLLLYSLSQVLAGSLAVTKQQMRALPFGRRRLRTSLREREGYLKAQASGIL